MYAKDKLLGPFHRGIEARKSLIKNYDKLDNVVVSILFKMVFIKSFLERLNVLKNIRWICGYQGLLEKGEMDTKL